MGNRPTAENVERWAWTHAHMSPEEWGETFITREEMARRWEERPT